MKLLTLRIYITIMKELNTYIGNTDYSGVKDFFKEKGKKQTFQKKKFFAQQNSISLYAGFFLYITVFAQQRRSNL